MSRTALQTTDFPRRVAHALLTCLLLAAGPAFAVEPPEITGAWLGLGGQYKLGCWTPLRVAVAGGEVPLSVQVVASTPDSDGVGYASLAPGNRPLSTEPGRESEGRLYVRIGKQDAPVEVQLLADGRRVDRRFFSVDTGENSSAGEEAGQRFARPTSATGMLVLQIGANVGADAALASLQPKNGAGWQSEFAAATITTADDLPRDAIGYDSFNAIVLTTGSWLADIGPNDERIQALTEWVEAGGRLVLSCGSNGPTLVAQSGPLADLVPGTYDGPQTITTATGIERFAEAPTDDGGLELLGGTLSVSGLSNVRGRVEAYAGRDASETPLVVRTPYGFGEVTFVAFDLDAPAIAGWQGRTALLARLLNLPKVEAVQPSAANNWTTYEEDVSSRLIRNLDVAFSGVQTAPFLLIVGLVVLYLLLIGPGDYFLVKRVLGRVEATWVTFPLLVLVTSAAAYAGAYWLKGDKLRVNQVEIVDIDTATSQTRGTLVTHVFSPRASRYDLSLAAETLNQEPLKMTSSNTAWLGKAGYGLGAMQGTSSAGQTGVRASYRIDATPLLGGLASPLPTVAGLPIQVWSTKTLVSRYSGKVDRSLDAALTPDGDGLVEGSITNDTGARLGDCRLLYGSWAWKLGDLGDGVSKEIDTSLSPLKITTLLGRQRNNNRDWSLDSIAESLAIGARSTGATGPGSRYLHFLDLTHRLDAGDALLLARVEGGPRSELTQPDGPLVDPESDSAKEQQRDWVYARFILPVGGD